MHRSRAIPLLLSFVCIGHAVAAVSADELQEVVITASLRPVSRLEAAASSTVLGDELRVAGVQHLQDVLPLVPNLNWASGSSRPRYFQLRGIGETDQWQGAPNPSVGFLIDGMDFSGVGMPATLLDVAQVEVLRGPQGTTLGANALAGLINVATRAAEPTSSLSLQFEGGGAGTYGAGLVAGGGLADASGDDESAWRVVAQKFRSDGFRRNAWLNRDDTNGLDERTLRARLRAAPAAGWKADVSLLWVDQDNGFDAFSIDNSRVTQSDQPGRDAQRSRGASIALDRQGDVVDLRSVSAVTDAEIVYAFDGDWGHDPGYDFTSRFLRRHRTMSQDLRVLSSADARTSWLAGVYALRVTETNDQLDLYGGEVYRALVSRYRADTLALYSDLRFAFDPKWALHVGARVEHRSTRYDDTDGTRVAPADTMSGGNASLEYVVDARSRGYLSISRGYKGGGFNIGAAVPASRRRFDPELLDAIELGYKFRDAAALRAELAVFYMRRSRQQVGTSVQVDPGDPLSFIYLTDNAARGENYGLEGSASWRVGRDLTLGASLGVLRARFLEYRVGARDLAGRATAHAPELQAAINLDYRHPRGWFARVDAQQQAGFYYSDSHDQRAPARMLMNMRVGYERRDWQASLWVRNLLDRVSAQRGFYFGNEPPDFPDKLYVQKTDPRQAGLTVSWTLR